MSWVKCPGCNEVMVEGENQRCFDCWCTDKQERQLYIWQLEERAKSALWDTRKQFAAAAITAARQMLSDTNGNFSTFEIATVAYEIADDMLAQNPWPPKWPPYPPDTDPTPPKESP